MATFIFNGNTYTKDTWVSYWVQNYQGDPFIRNQFANLFYDTNLFYGAEIDATGPARIMWERIGDWAIEQAKKKPGFTVDRTNLQSGISWALNPNTNKTLKADFGGYLKEQGSENQGVNTTEQQVSKADVIIELKKFAYNNGLTFTDAQYNFHANRIVGLGSGGKRDVRDANNDGQLSPAELLRDTSASQATLEGTKQMLREKYVLPKYLGFADEVKAGFDVRDIANDYIQMVGNALEIDPETLDLNDPLLAKALRPAGKKGQFDYISYGDFEKEVKKDKRWWNTSNAKEAASQTALQVQKMFGF
jgi:hypothetical protein